MGIKKEKSWLEYLNTLSLQEFKPEQVQVEGIENMLSVNHQFNRFFFHSVPLVYVLDYTTGRYITMSKSAKAVLGYAPSAFMEGGIGFTIDNYHKEDLEIYDRQIFPKRLEVLKNIPAAEQAKYIFSYNFRMRNSNGDYVNLLQRNCFIKSDEKGKPLVSFGMVINISHYKKENPIIQIVERIDDEEPDMGSSRIVHKDVFYLHNEDRLFSKREKEVLLWTAEGLTSKEIAQKLFLSDSTIINHRKNMMLKSNTKNTSELVAFALKNEII